MSNLLSWFERQFESSRGDTVQSNIRPMEGLRGFAVFLVHYSTLIQPWILEKTLFIENIHTIGSAGVDLFFVLSGYLIYGSLITRSQNFFKYMFRRIKRIYPTFSVVFILYICLSLIFTAENKILGTNQDKLIFIIQNFLLLPGLFPIKAIITVAWSLSYEMFYYIAVPVVISLFNLRIWRTSFKILFFLTLTIAIVTYSIIYADGHVRLIMFISGIILYEISKNNLLQNLNSVIGIICLVAGLYSTLLPTQTAFQILIKYETLFITFCLFCLLCFQKNSLLFYIFSWKPIRWLGNMSYSYYLIHCLALKMCFFILPIFLPTAHYDSILYWQLIFPAFIVTLIPATILFFTIEKPFSLASHTKTTS